MSTIAIIQFPGCNCEYETLTAVEAAGMRAEIVRWNTPANELSHYDGFVLPGGFSYQDRVRSGAIAAKLPIIEALIEADKQDKPILGICNGCQILAEVGLIPNSAGNLSIEAALTPNRYDEKAVGFICDWKYVKVKHPEKNIFTKSFSQDSVLPIPINHGEGRFVFKEGLDVNHHAMIQYCDENGKIDPGFKVNPNGSSLNCAGLSNEKGNVLALMPHPERATFIKQIPSWIDEKWVQDKKTASDLNAPGPWQSFFENMKCYIQEKAELCHAS